MLSRLEKLLLAAGFAASLLLSCSKDNPISSGNPIITPKQNNPPVIVSTPPTFANENQLYNYQIVANDADKDPLTYSLIKKPSWLSISNSGLVSGLAPEVSSDQINDIEISVSDGKSHVPQKYALTLKNLFNVYVLGAAQTGNLINVDSAKLVFSQPMNFSAGDIVASGINQQTPYGILREVNSVSSDKKTFYTSQAALEQTVKDASLSHTGKLLPSDVASSISLEGVNIPLGYSKVTGFDFNIALKNVVLYDHDKNLNTTDDQLLANGNISFSMSTALDLKIHNYNITDFTFKNLTNIESDVAVGFNVLGIAQLYQVKVAEFKFKPFIMGYLPTAIPIPIIVAPRLGVYVEIDPTFLNPLSVRVKQTATSDVGLVYNGAWNPTSNFSNSFEFSNPVINNNSELKVHAGPNLEFLLYGIAGPFGAARGRLRLKYENNSWELYGGFGAALGVKMDVFKKKASLQFRDIINYEKLLVKGSSPTLPGKILFSRYFGGNNRDIMVMNPTGSGVTNLTNTSSLWEVYASWSPNAAKILYSSKIPFSSDDFDIYVMNANGSNKTQLTTSSMGESNAVFSTDGSKIAYIAGYDAGYHQIYIMNSDGSNPIQITNNPGYYHRDLSWSPSPRIAFISNKNHALGEIYTINSDGSDERRLTYNSYYDRFPSWSPDGSKIAFETNRDGNLEIYVMDSDGTNQTNISNSPGTSDSYPSWSPDGTKIVYEIIGSGLDGELWIMDYPSGSNNIRINNNGSSPIWSPK